MKWKNIAPVNYGTCCLSICYKTHASDCLRYCILNVLVIKSHRPWKHQITTYM